MVQEVAVRDEAGACAGGSSSAELAEPICGGSLPSARWPRRWTISRSFHGSSDDGGARGGWGGRESCSGATTTARRRGGRLRQRTWGELAVHDQAGACAGGSSSAQPAKPICGGTLPSTAAAETTEGLGAGVKGARAAPARPRGLAGEGALASASWGELAVRDEAGARAGGSSSA